MEEHQQHRNTYPATAAVKQLSIYGAVADWCQELAQQIADHSSSCTRNLVVGVNNDLEPKVAPADLSILTSSPIINVLARGNSVQHH